MECPSCHLTQVPDYSNSSIACTNCGTVLEESQIVSDVTFAENSAGGAVVQGSYVGNDQRGARTQGPGGYRSGGVGASREQTVANAKHAIRALGMAKQVPQNVIDKAGRLFSLALEGGTYKTDGSEPHNYVLGRKSEYTQASCLYVACRMERTNHMLIDFADAIGVNVFVLGRSYLRLIRCLGFSLPVIDPSIYISRFASLLDFGDETQKVAMDATRLVQRFKKDWITHGRRPAGVCGACLLLAARMNNFRRSVAEIIQVVKIADVTLRKRLDEFKQTASSKLTIDDFRHIWLEEESEPPAYYLARRPKKSKKAGGESAKRRKMEDGGDEEAADEEEDGNEADDEGLLEAKKEYLEEQAADPRLDVLADEATRREITEYLNDDAARQIEESEQTNRAKRSDTAQPGDPLEDFADLDDEELDAFILTEAEVKIKERVWMEFNKDYLERMLERQLKQEADIKAGIKPASARKKRSNKPRDSSTAPPTAGESAKQMMRKKNFSKRLNYDVISSIFDEKPVVQKTRKRGHNDDDEEESDEDEEDEAEVNGQIHGGDADGLRALFDRQRKKKKSTRNKSIGDEESATEGGTSHYTDVDDTEPEESDWRKDIPGFATTASGMEDNDDDLYEGEGEGVFG